MDFGKLLNGLDADSIADVVQLVIDNREVIGNLGRLPELFDSISTSLAAAGAEAEHAAIALIGDTGESGARGTLVAAAAALGDIVDAFDKGANLVADTAKSAARVPLMDGPAGHLGDAAAQLSSANARLRDLATSMDSIADVLAAVGAALGKVGSHLTDTGGQARGFMATPQ